MPVSKPKSYGEGVFSMAGVNQLLLQMPVSKLKSYGEGAFSVADSTLWNRLPEEVRNKPSLESFKLLLKTHLFKIAFLKLNNY